MLSTTLKLIETVLEKSARPRQSYPLNRARAKGPLSHVAARVGRLKDVLERLIIENRQYKNRDVLQAMHQTVLETPRFRCNPDARVEIHTLTAHHHVSMYVTAIKSLLRFYDDLAVVVHDDGSLDNADRSSLQHHVRGLRVIDRTQADKKMNQVLAGFPHSQRLRDCVVNSLELFDNMLLSDADRIVNMNSDVLFFREPTELISWLVRDDNTIAGIYEEQPAEQRKFLLEQSCPFPPHVTTALTCFQKGICDLKFVESVLAETRHDWFTAQNIYPLLYNNKKNEHITRFFDKDRYQASGVFGNDAVFRHYWTSTGLFTKLQYADSRRVICELAAPRA